MTRMHAFNAMHYCYFLFFYLYVSDFFPLFSPFSSQLYPICSNHPYCSETSVSRALLYTAIQQPLLSPPPSLSVGRALLYTAIQQPLLSPPPSLSVGRALLYTAIQQPLLSPPSSLLPKCRQGSTVYGYPTAPAESSPLPRSGEPIMALSRPSVRMHYCYNNRYYF